MKSPMHLGGSCSSFFHNKARSPLERARIWCSNHLGKSFKGRRRVERENSTMRDVVPFRTKFLPLPACFNSFGIMHRMKCGDVDIKVDMSLFSCSYNGGRFHIL